MLCTKCGKELNEEWKVCPFCQTPIKEKRKSIIPGFRTNKKWKKVVAIIGYVLMILVMWIAIQPQDYGLPSDRKWQMISNGIYCVVCFIYPFVILTNFLGIRNKLPLFKRHKFLHTCLGWVVWSMAVLLIAGIADSFVQPHFSEQYYTDIATAEEEEREKAEAEEKAKEEAEEKAQEEAEIKKKEEEQAKAEAEKQAQEERNKEEKIAKENRLSLNFARWYAKENNLDIHSFAVEKKILDTFINGTDINIYNAVNLEIEPFTGQYKRTIENTDLYYIGSMKDNHPDGLGIIFSTVYIEQDEYGIYIHKGVRNIEKEYLFLAPVYAGSFSDGKANGFGYSYFSAAEIAEQLEKLYGVWAVESSETVDSENIQNIILEKWSPCIYEGYFENSKREGKGNEYIYGSLNQYIGEEYDALFGTTTYMRVEDYEKNQMEDNDMYYHFLIEYTTFFEVLSGEYDNGKANGDFKIYCNEYLIYKGDVKKGKREGEGTSYYYGGTQIQYKGGWKTGKYHGKGTEYDENGGIIYSGEWKYGDCK